MISYRADDFNAKTKDNKYQKAAEKEFEVFKNNRLSGMPTLILEVDDKKVLASNGDIDFEELKIRIGKYVA